MKRNLSIALILFVIAIIGYMWFGYANIYNRIRAGGLKTVDTQYVYTFNEVNPHEVRYAAIGDSLTAGAGTDNYEESYPYSLAEELAKNEKVVLSDFSFLGARTEDIIGKGLLVSAVKATPDIVTLLIGVNDVREGISAKDFKDNYEYIVSELLNDTNARVYLISIPFIGSNTLYLPPYSWYFKNKTVEFNKVISGIAAEHNLTYIDIANPTKQIFEKDSSYYSVDSFHPSKEGYKILTQLIYDGINQ